MIKRFEAFLVGAEVVAEKEFESGECEVKMRLNLRTLYKELPPNKAEVVRRRLMAERARFYGEADLTVESRDVPHLTVVEEIVSRLRDHLLRKETQP